MSFFVTETTDEAPSVLLIASANSFQHEVTALFEKKGVLVVHKEPADFVSQNLSAQTFYKIIWITEAWSGGEVQQKVLERLRQRSEPKIILARTVTSISTQDERLQEWSWASSNQKFFIDQLMKSDLHASIFLMENVIDPLETASLPLNWLVPRAKQRRLLSPAVKLVAQSPHTAFAEISSSFFDTYLDKKNAVKGAYTLDVATLHALYEQIFTVDVPVDTVDVHVQALPDTFRAIQSKPEDIKNELATIVSLHPPASILSEIALPQPEVSGARFAPIPTPVIENRMKKYERKKKQTAEQKKAKKYLHQFAAPVPLQKKVATPKKNVKLEENEQLIDEKIQHLFGEHRAAQKISRVTKNAKKAVKIEQKNQRRTALVVFMTLVIGVGVIAGLATSVFHLTRRVVLSNITHFPTQPAYVSFLLEKQVNLYQLILGASSLPESSILAAIGQELGDVNTGTTQLQDQAQQSVLSFFGKNSSDNSQLLTNIADQTTSLYKTLSILQAQLAPENFPSFSDDQLKGLTALSTQLQEKRRTLANAQQVQQILPLLLAQHGRKSYIIMLQNNNELRPTGGFFHTFAWVTIENGVFIDSQVYDVASVDAQFQGAFQPPLEVQKYLASNRWLLRDANWDPNFPTTADQVSTFIEKSLGKKADGVIAMNLLTLQSILRDLGPVNVSEYNEVVTDKNLLGRVASHSEIQLVQTDKPDYLTDVFGKVLAEVQAMSPDKVNPFLSDVSTALRQDQAFIVTSDPAQNTVLSGIGWTGELSTPQCPAQFSDVTCIVDSTMQVEANVGVNQANYAIDRSIQENIAVARDGISHERIMTFHNTATSEAWPMGTYRNYLRVYVPQSAQLKTITIDDAVVPATSITIGHEGSKEYFGVLVEVPIQKTVSVKLDYLEPTVQSGAFSYAFFDQKQAGTGADPLQITLQPDASLHPTLIAPAATLGQSSIQFSGVRDKHTFVGVKFQ